MALATELDVQHHRVVVLARQGRLGLVAGEPLVDHDAAARTADPAGQLVAGGQVVFDHGNAGHGGLGLEVVLRGLSRAPAGSGVSFSSGDGTFARPV